MTVACLAALSVIGAGVQLTDLRLPARRVKLLPLERQTASRFGTDRYFLVSDTGNRVFQSYASMLYIVEARSGADNAVRFMELNGDLSRSTGSVLISSWQKPLKGWPRVYWRAGSGAGLLLASRDGKSIVLVHQSLHHPSDFSMAVSQVRLDSPDPRRNRTNWKHQDTPFFRGAVADRRSDKLLVVLSEEIGAPAGSQPRTGPAQGYLDRFSVVDRGRAREVGKLRRGVRTGMGLLLFDSAAGLIVMARPDASPSRGKLTLWRLNSRKKASFGFPKPKLYRDWSVAVFNAAFVGDRGFLIQLVYRERGGEGRGHEALYLFDMRRRRWTDVGPYRLVGRSASGSVLLLRSKNDKDKRHWLVWPK